MEAFAEQLLKYIVGGGPGAITAILMLVVVVLGWWILRQDKVIEKKDAAFQEVVDKKFAGDLAVAESLNQLRTTIWELVRSKL